MKKISRFSLAIALLALLIGASVLRASNQTWTNPAGGDWNTGTNWTSAVPGVGDNATLTAVMGNYTVDYATPMVSGNLTAVLLSDNATQTATLNIAAGGFNLTGGLSIGTGGAFNVNTGGNATFGTGIGMTGGTFNINGGTLSSGGDFMMAQANTTQVVTITSGTLNFTSGNGRIFFGGYSRNSSFNINGGTVNCNSIQAGDTSAFNITSGALNVGGYIDLGVASGNLGGALSMAVSGGTVINGSYLNIGSKAGRQATVTMSNGTWTSGTTVNGNVYIGNIDTQDAGIFNLSGGTFHNIRGLTIGTAAYTGTAGTFEGTLNQSGGTWTNDMAVTVGTAGAGKLAISAGTFTAHSASNNATVTVGAAGVPGTLVLSGTGNMTVDGLVATSGANSTVTFNGGTLNTKATTINTGSVFTVGNGATAASLILNGGNHSFANGITLANNAMISGTGTITSGTLTVSSGATITAGSAAPGTLNTAAQTWLGGGIYVWKINNATGAQGTNWDFLNGSGTLDISTLSPSSKFIIDLVGLAAGNVSGAVPNWNKDVDWAWKIGTFSNITGTFNAAYFNVDASAFTNNNPLTAGGVFSISNVGNDLFVSYSSTSPEPSTWILVGLSLPVIFCCRHWRRTRDKSN